MENNSNDQNIQHFSHPHLLELTNPQAQTLTLIPPYCSACKLQSSGSMYTCKTCNNFTLHVSCSQMPQLITHHLSHPSHPLSLLPKSIHPGGVFHCDGCGHRGDGFSYRCNTCDFDLHMLCASKPQTITHHSHPHQLQLTFDPPYYNQTNGSSFTCDICGNAGANQWLYRCSSCQFDAHLYCATNIVMNTSRTRSLPQPQPQPRPNQAPAANGMNNYQRPSATTSIMQAAVGGLAAGAVGQVGQQFGHHVFMHDTNNLSDGNNNDRDYNNGSSDPDSSSSSIFDIVVSYFMDGMFSNLGP